MKVQVSNIKFENETVKIQVPKDMTDVKLWIAEDCNTDVTDQQALEAYVRAMIFETQEITYDIEHIKDSNGIELNKIQLFSLNAIDQKLKSFDTITVKIDHKTDIKLVSDSETYEMFDNDIDLFVFDELRNKLELTITVI